MSKKIDEEKINPTENYDKVTAEGFGATTWEGGTGIAGQIEDYASKIAGMNYDDFTKGTDYASLAKRYSQQGKKAMDDTIGQVAARTGGLASSFATAAGNQAYNEHMGKLEDAARALYDSQRSEAMENYNLAQNMYDRKYSEYQDQRNFAYGEYRDSVGDAQWADTVETNQANINQNQENIDREWDHKVGRDAEEDARTRLKNHIANGGNVTGDVSEEIQSLITASGLSMDELEQMQNNRGFTNSQLEAQEELMMAITAGVGNTSYLNNLVKRSGRSKEYWKAYEAMKKGEEVPEEDIAALDDPDKIAIWQDYILGAKTLDEVWVYYDNLVELSPDTATAILGLWGEAHPENKEELNTWLAQNQ